MTNVMVWKADVSKKNTAKRKLGTPKYYFHRNAMKYFGSTFYIFNYTLIRIIRILAYCIKSEYSLKMDRKTNQEKRVCHNTKSN